MDECRVPFVCVYVCVLWKIIVFWANPGLTYPPPPPRPTAPATTLVYFCATPKEIPWTRDQTPQDTHLSVASQSHPKCVCACVCVCVAHVPVLQSQRMSFPSVEHDARMCPDGEKVQQCTEYLCPQSGELPSSAHSPSAHRRSVLSPDADASATSLNATDVTSVRCALMVCTSVAWTDIVAAATVASGLFKVYGPRWATSFPGNQGHSCEDPNGAGMCPGVAKTSSFNHSVQYLDSSSGRSVQNWYFVLLNPQGKCGMCSYLGLCNGFVLSLLDPNLQRSTKSSPTTHHTLVSHVSPFQAITG